MGFEFRILQAHHGDSILISCEFDDQPRNVLIDGGPPKTFKYQHAEGSLKKTLRAIKANNQKIDLLILTHVDDDHIGGLLAGFKNKGLLEELTQEVWFNSGKLIFNSFNEPLDETNLVTLEPKAGNKTSITQGIKLEEHLEKLEIWDHPLIKSGDILEKFGITFKVLSPSTEKLSKLLVKWEREHPETITSSGETDYSLSFSELLDNDKFNEDQSIHNGSSIAFILETQQKSILFLGDAHPSVVIDSLTKLGYSVDNPLNIDYMKISHHGSKANTNSELLELITCKNFIISTNGLSHKLPNKKTLARIVQHFPTANLMFNYPHLIKQIFTPDELHMATFSVSECTEVICL